jgi:hypothetical protein
MSTGDFFAIDRRTWARVCGLGMNPAVAYLVLARFTGKTNRTTAASVHAIETYTSISRGRARVAIDKLIQCGWGVVCGREASCRSRSRVEVTGGVVPLALPLIPVLAGCYSAR